LLLQAGKLDIMAYAIRFGALTRRALIGGLAAGACAAGAWPVAAEPGDLDAPQPIEITARVLQNFQSSRPDVRRFGDLEFRGGLVLSSPSEHFGGLSGLVLDAEGKRLLAVSDRGSWLSATVEYSKGAAPTAVTGARMGPLLALRGRTLKSKREQDAESIALVEGTLERGTVLIGFERVHRIGRFEVRGGEVQAPTGYQRLAAEAGRMPSNQGLEALTTIQAGPLEGTLVGFAERLTRGSGYHTGWIWAGGQPQRFQLRDIDEFNVTGAAGLPDGGLLVLERFFRWSTGVKMRIRRLAPAEIRPGARLDGHVVFEGDSGYEIDNMEGIAVHRGARGETVVTLISDDNFSRLLQRTVFLQFTLLE
jgi:hypothetical protein